LRKLIGGLCYQVSSPVPEHGANDMQATIHILYRIQATLVPKQNR